MEVNWIVVLWFVLLVICIVAMAIFVLTTRGGRSSPDKSQFHRAVDHTLKANGLRRRRQIIAALIFLIGILALVSLSAYYLKYHPRGRDTFAAPSRLR